MPTVFLPCLSQWRRKSGLTQVTLAKLAGLTPETVCRYERQQRPASFTSAQRLAELLGVALDDLTSGAPMQGPGPTRTTVFLPSLRVWRKNAGLKQFQLAQMAGLTPDTVCGYERQRRPASVASAQLLAELLGVGLDVLTRGVPMPKPGPTSPKARPKLPATERVCTDCKRLKPIAAFVRIRATRTGHYGRCRSCRARRARERYWADPVEREAVKARGRRNQQRRRAVGP